MLNFRQLLALGALALPMVTVSPAQAAAISAQVIPLKRGDSSGTAEVLRELHLGNLPATRLRVLPIPWLPGTPVEVYRVREHRLQFHRHASPAAAGAAKSALLKQLRGRQTRLIEPTYVTRCGSDAVLEFGPGEAMIGAADQTCEHPIDIRAYARIERDRDAARLLAMLARNGSSRQAFDAWSPLPERGPGFAYAIPSGYLYLHVSPTPAEAERARQQWADYTPNEFPQNRQWAYRCGRALVVYDQRQGKGINALLRRQCGAPIVGRAVVRD